MLRLLKLLIMLSVHLKKGILEVSEFIIYLLFLLIDQLVYVGVFLVIY